MLKKLLLSLFIFGLAGNSTSLFSAFEKKLGNARAVGRGGLPVGLVDGPTMINPAYLLGSSYFLLESFVSELLACEDLRFQGVSFQYPTFRRKAWGLNFLSFGNNLYREEEYAFLQGFAFTPHWDSAYRLKILRLSIENYGTAQTLAIDWGNRFRISPEFSLGLCLTNLNSPRLGEAEESPARSFLIGGEYCFQNLFGINLDWERDFRDKCFIFHSGIEARLLSFLWLRLGLIDQPSRFTAGLGIYQGIFSFDYALITHPYLPLESHFSLSLRWPR